MNNFREIYKSLTDNYNSTDAYMIEKVAMEGVFIGISPDKNPSILLMLNNDDGQYRDKLNLNGIRAEFGVACNYFYEGEIKKSIFNIVSCLDDDRHIQIFFFDFFERFFKREKNVSTMQLRNEIDFIRELFASTRKPSEETIMGLWSELFIINMTNDTELWVDKWPKETRSTFDFSFDHIGIDVKSFGGNVRKHFFKYDQLENKSVEQTLILSTCVKKDETGQSIIDLLDQISSKINDAKLLEKLEKKILKIIGPESDKSILRYNSTIAENELKILEGKSIPSIKKGSFSSNVSEIRFISNCMDVPNLPFSEKNQKQITKGVLKF